ADSRKRARSCRACRFETVAKPPPELVEAFAQGATRFRRKSPAPRVVQRPLQAVKGLGCCAIRWPRPAILAAPQQWHPAAAVLQGQLVTRFHGRFLRTVSENSGSSQRLLGASAQAILLSRN